MPWTHVSRLKGKVCSAQWCVARIGIWYYCSDAFTRAHKQFLRVFALVLLLHLVRTVWVGGRFGINLAVQRNTESSCVGEMSGINQRTPENGSVGKVGSGGAVDAFRQIFWDS